MHEAGPVVLQLNCSCPIRSCAYTELQTLVQILHCQIVAYVGATSVAAHVPLNLITLVCVKSSYRSPDWTAVRVVLHTACFNARQAKKALLKAQSIRVRQAAVPAKT